MRSRILVGGLLAALVAISGSKAARADILIKTDGSPVEGKLVSQSATEVVFKPDPASTAPQKFDRQAVARVLTTDAHGAVLSDGTATTQPAVHWNVPPEPAAPAIVAPPRGPTYYVVPLHGEVGVTVLASALDKSLADAVARKATVVILDIDSPGGLVEEAKKIMAVIHKYNKQTRIVALANQDLSAAAILSLSCKHIFVKATGTIGAAVAYNPANLTLPPKLEEKMQSAWRAVARNSAEEGGHEPLLAEAMIDNSLELHLEAVGGKNVVKEGPGEPTLCRKGKILTLSSHEAVECRLADALADDYAEVGKALGMPNWTECQGLAAPLAEYLPKRAEAFKAELETIQVRFSQDLKDAVNADPSRSTVTVINPPPQRLAPPIITRHTGIIPRHSIAPAFPRQSVTIVSTGSPATWKRDSLLCVVALNDAEADLKTAHSLCEAFGQEGQAEEVNNALGQVAAVRAKVFDARNKFGTDTTLASNGGASTQPVDVTIDGRTANGGSYHREIHIEHNTSSTPAGGQVPSTPAAGPIAGSIKTAIFGGRGGGPFTKVGHGGPVLGFHYRFGGWAGRQVLGSVDPQFERPAGSQAQDPAIVMAREGYIVGGLIANVDKVNAFAFRVIFVRYNNGVVDPATTYTTDWIGKPLGDTTQQLAGKGEIVVGLCGQQGMNCDALGLVVLPVASAPGAQESSPVAVSGSAAAPVPDAASQANALKLLQEVHAPYPPTDRAARKDLAVKMLDEAGHTTDDASQHYVLLREARDMAAGVGDWATVDTAINSLTESYRVDALAMRMAALNQAATVQSAPAPDLMKLAAEAVDSAIAADRYEDAVRAATLAELWARGAKDDASVTAAQTRLARARTAQKDFPKFNEAMRTLKDKPADPNANLIAGRFKCLDKGDWEQGLTLLAKGSDADLKAAAAADLGLPATKVARISLANAWWALSERASEPSVRPLKLRAAFWYQQALPDVTAPLEQAYVSKRLAAVAPAEADAGPAANNVDCLGMIRPAIHNRAGTWTLENGKLTSSGQGFEVMTIPYKLAEEYDVTATFTRLTGNEDINFVLTANGSTFLFKMGAWYNSVIGADDTGNQSASTAPESIRGQNLIPSGVANQVVIKVRRNVLTATVNGKEYHIATGNYAGWHIDDWWHAASGCTFGLCTQSSSVRFDSVRVTNVTGTGTRQ